MAPTAEKVKRPTSGIGSSPGPMNARFVLILSPRPQSQEPRLKIRTPKRGQGDVGVFGFTLIELMVVIVLIGILSAMIIPEMRGTYEEARLRSTSRQLVDLCHLAYSRAVSMQLEHHIVLDPINGKFVLEKREVRTTPRRNFVPADDVSGSKGELDTRIGIKFHRRTEDMSGDAGAETTSRTVAESSDPGGRVVIGFYPDGTADPAEIQLRDRQGFGLLLKISPVTARVRILELPRE